MLNLLTYILFACTETKINIIEDKSGEGESEQGTGSSGSVLEEPEECVLPGASGEEVGLSDSCVTEPEGGFVPVVEWSYGTGLGCLALPIVADITGDGNPEILLNLVGGLGIMETGTLTVLKGDGSGLLWSDPYANLGYGSPVAVADINNDSAPEIVGVREYSASLFDVGDYTVVAWNAQGSVLWESEHFTGLDFDYATAPHIADMNADGTPEIIAGRVILNNDGTTSGVGAHGRGSYGADAFVSESAVSAVADLDLDGQSELIVGDARYDINGTAVWHDSSQSDAMIAIANLDADPEGEVIATSYNTIRAVDTDGTILWGPTALPSANILSPPAIADLDGDGQVEIITAGGNELRCLNHDGSTLWSAPVVDESGATGASIFDFEGDGFLEVVYIDEQEMVAYDGATGAVKFYSSDHASPTMFDYPVIADVDMDNNAEILVCHNGFGHAFSVYGDQDASWRPARPLWNQHAYHIGNINDDLSVPAVAEPNFHSHNTWHSAIAVDESSLQHNLEPIIVDVCEEDCDAGTVWLTFQIHNSAPNDFVETVLISIYAVDANGDRLIEKIEFSQSIAAGWTSDGIEVALSANALQGSTAIRVSLDDDGFGNGVLTECSETDNQVQFSDSVCD
ncbi:MAG: hypothetical protein VX278_15650 [Myxococcota bacterium]|nr:hypothetical protein [Myxococcota bacterium]